MKSRAFFWYAIGVLIYNVGVILWGAFVRATGSGAGCGSHWPTCNGQVIPRAPAVETMIEFSHRVTSGIAGLLVLAMFIWAFRLFGKGHPVRLGATLALVFIIIESLVGAGLVLFGLTGDNSSVARAVVIAIHLVNTFMLLAGLTLTPWWSAGAPPIRLAGQGQVLWLLSVAIVGALLLGASGAVTALGDTLFPVATLREGIARDFATDAHFLERLRVIHPAIAIVLGLYLAVMAQIVRRLRPGATTRRMAFTLGALYGVQLIVGMINVRLLAPVWMQMIHLLLADAVWIALVLLAAAALAEPERSESPACVFQPVPRATN
jgi:heme A synthase